MLILIIASGPDKGRIYEAAEGESLVLGREGDQIRLDDHKVSRRHARLWSEGGTWYIEDFQSRHGTYRNQKPVGRKTPLKDGDRIQIGATVLVLARMPAEHADRLVHAIRPALAAVNTDAQAAQEEDAASASHDEARAQRRLPSITSITSGVTAIAALLALAASAVVLFNGPVATSSSQSSDQAQLAKQNQQILDSTNQLSEQVTGVRQATESASATMLAEVRGLEVGTDTRVVEQKLAEMRQQQADQIEKLVSIQQTLASSPKQNRPLLDAILAQTQVQREQAQQLADLRKAVQSQQTASSPVLEKLADAAAAAKVNQQSLASLRDQLQTAIKQSQSADGSDDQAVDTAALTAALQELQTTLESRPSAEQIAEPMQQALAQRDQRTSRKLDAVLNRLEMQVQLQDSMLSLHDQVQQLRVAQQQAAADQVEADQVEADQVEADQADADPTLQKILEAVRSDDGFAERLARIETLVTQLPDQQQAQLSASMEHLRTDLAAQAERVRETEKLIAGMREAIAQRPTGDELAAQFDALNQAQAARAAALGEELVARLQQSPELIDHLAQLHRKIEAQPKETRQQIEAALAKLDQPAADTGNRNAANTSAGGQRNKAVLTAINDLRDAMPRNVTPLLEEVLAAVRSQKPGDAAAGASPQDMKQDMKATEQVLRRLRLALGDDLQNLRQAVRNEVRAALREQQVAGPHADAGAAADRARRTGAVDQRVDQRDHAGHAGHADSEPLTRMQRAYKLAFETGQPVTIGGGVMNPKTGEVSSGRTLDPAAARAAGIESWREWYEIDDMAQRMRLQYQARQAAAQWHNQPNVITLPDDKDGNARRDNITPAEDDETTYRADATDTDDQRHPR